MTSFSSTQNRFSRRTLVRGTAFGIAVVAGCLASPQVPLALGSPRLSAASPRSRPPQAPAWTPLGDQLAWFLAAVNDGGTALTETEIAAHVAPALLATVPRAQIVALVQGLAAGFGALKLEGVTRPPTATQAVALVTAQGGLSLALPMTVEDTSPSRITGLNVYPVPSASGEALHPMSRSSADFEQVARSPLVDIGGRRLYQSGMGTGGPTVVLDAGLGDSAASWSGVIPGIAAFTQVVSYDRPNTQAGASDAAPTPRSGDDVVADLHALLDNAALPGPYVLVGHSMGGLFAGLYASRFPDAVAGLVLIDSSHEMQFEGLQGVVSPAMLAAVKQAASAEGMDLDATFAQMGEARTATPLRPMPLIVLSAGKADPADWPAGWPMIETAQLHQELQEDLASLVPGGRLVVAEQSGHYIQQSEPDLVVEAIHQVVEAVRNPPSWSTPLVATPAP